MLLLIWICTFDLVTYAFWTCTLNVERKEFIGYNYKTILKQFQFFTCPRNRFYVGSSLLCTKWLAVSLVCLLLDDFWASRLFTLQRTFTSLINLTKLQIQFKTSPPSSLPSQPVIGYFWKWKRGRQPVFFSCSVSSQPPFPSSSFCSSKFRVGGRESHTRQSLSREWFLLIVTHFKNRLSHRYFEVLPSLGISPP